MSLVPVKIGPYKARLKTMPEAKPKGGRSTTVPMRAGTCGEKLARQDLAEEGYTDIVAVQNKSGHGVDLIGRNPRTGNVKVWEVKATTTTRTPRLSKAQGEMGGKEYTENRLGRAMDAKGNYGKVPEAKANAKQAWGWIRKALPPASVAYEKYDVYLDADKLKKKRCAKNPEKPSQPSRWDPIVKAA